MRRVEPSLLVAVAGVLVSAYLTVEHFTSPAVLACPAGQVINCAKVTTSPYAVIVGVPVAVLGLAYYLIMAVLVSPSAWRRPRLDVLRVVGVVTGVIMVLYLVWVELFAVNALCLWCTAVHVITLALFSTVLWRVAGRRA